MFKKQMAATLAAMFLSASAFALDPHGHGDSQSQVAAFVNHLTVDNASYIAAKNPAFFAELSKGQHPKATVVTCSDSRVHTKAISTTPEDELFMVRDIGNQMSTAEGSVEYGVHHLHTPILLFIGHSRCGAINAAGGDYSKESAPIKRELDTISIPKGGENIDGVKINVNNQVAAASKKFAEEVKEGHLTVIGAVFDFADDMKKGAGKLNIINVNGETDPAKLRNLNELAAKAEHEHAHH
ncbi:hypothetical protein FGKAn22_22230 [Ferrigenium kumadai]|uniref:carbonic anhydrase n=1 Tax=Ferrigenium kumadai TaxID=1682490 RepID=A0AAN1T1S4_9PROT|nr:carbonic anhydrase [Ferrigenium kumadai]BBJ00531.1 hypothetical protein FGKAn22_22230 [Ferrigenium kumadai]